MPGKGVWCLDIGSHAIKALKAHKAGSRIEISVFDVVEYDRPLDFPEVDAPEQIEKALMRFLHRNDAERDRVLVATSGQSALFRFIPLPPVSKHKVPEIVKYEARQQIPFPLEEVVWDYDTLDRGSKSSEQIEVGLFAMKKELIFQALAPFRSLGFDIDAIQLVPNALYNFLNFEKPQGAEAHIILDIGARCTNLVVVNEEVVWPRILQIAGSDFTQTIQEAFDIPYSKAEKLKKRVKKHKYADKIYKSLRPTLDRLVDEVQRSMGFFKSTHKGVRIESIVAMGGAFKLPGMIKYLEDHLNYDVKTISSLQNFDIERALNPQLFRDNIISFGVCLGLAVQGLFPERSIDVSLLPEQFLFNKFVQKKRPWAAGVAAVIGVSVLAAGFKEAGQSMQIEDAQAPLETVSRQIQSNQEARRKYEEAKVRIEPVAKRIESLTKLFRARGNYLYSGSIDDEGRLVEDAVYRSLFRIIRPDPRVRGRDVSDWPALARQLRERQARPILESLSQAAQEAIGTIGDTAPDQTMASTIIAALNDQALFNRNLSRQQAVEPLVKDLEPLSRTIHARLISDAESVSERDIAWLNRRLIERLAGDALAAMPEQFIWLASIETRPYPREVWLYEIDTKLRNAGRPTLFFGEQTTPLAQWSSSDAGRDGDARQGGGAALRDGFSVDFKPEFFSARTTPQVRLRSVQDGGAAPGLSGPGDPATTAGELPEPLREMLAATGQPELPVVKVRVYAQMDVTGRQQYVLLKEYLEDPLSKIYYPVFDDEAAPVRNVESGNYSSVTVYRHKETRRWHTADQVNRHVEEKVRALNLPRERMADAQFLERRREQERQKEFEEREIFRFTLDFVVDPTWSVPRHAQNALRLRREQAGGHMAVN